MTKQKQDKPITKTERDEAVRTVVNKAIEWYRNSLRAYPLQEEIALRIAVQNLIKLGW